jgi:hypothetical protein
MFFQQTKYRAVTEKQILDAVKSDKLFGLVEKDLGLPECWDKEVSPKDFFEEMPPIFMTTLVPFEDFGEHMQDHVKQHKLPENPRKALVNGFRGAKVLLITLLLK